MSEDVFPRRNLPNAAEPWGRKHDDVVRAHGRRITNLELSTQGNNRANAGQLGVIGRQLETLSLQQDQLSAQQGQLSTQQDQLSDQQTLLQSQVTELQNRKTVTASPANLSVSGSATIPPLPVATRTFTLPAPNVRRAALITVNANLTNSNNNHTARAFVELLYGSTVISRWDGAVPNSLSAPSGWADTLTISRALTIPSGSNPSFSLRLTRLGFTSTATTITMSSIAVNLQYSDPV